MIRRDADLDPAGRRTLSGWGLAMSDDGQDRYEVGAARRWWRWRMWVVLLLALVVVVVLWQVLCHG